MPTPAFEKYACDVAAIVDAIPKGRFMSYGDIGKALGISPRYVAHIMATAEEIRGTPWHRVVGADGSLKNGGHRSEQKTRLLAEGVSFDGNRILEWRKRIYRPS